MSRILATFAGLLICCGMQAQCYGEKVTLRVMTFNLYHGGVRLGQPLSQSVKAIKAARADIVGIQESHAGSVDNAEQIAERLGWHHFAQGGRTAVISRFPIVGNTPGILPAIHFMLTIKSFLCRLISQHKDSAK